MHDLQMENHVPMPNFRDKRQFESAWKKRVRVIYSSLDNVTNDTGLQNSGDGRRVKTRATAIIDDKTI